MSSFRGHSIRNLKIAFTTITPHISTLTKIKVDIILTTGKFQNKIDIGDFSRLEILVHVSGHLFKKSNFSGHQKKRSFFQEEKKGNEKKNTALKRLFVQDVNGVFST